MTANQNELGGPVLVLWRCWACYAREILLEGKEGAEKPSIILVEHPCAPAENTTADSIPPSEEYVRVLKCRAGLDQQMTTTATFCWEAGSMLRPTSIHFAQGTLGHGRERLESSVGGEECSR